MSKRTPRVCPICKKSFAAYSARQRFCSRPCYLAAKRNGYSPIIFRKAPETVFICLPTRLPVFPEFQLTPGVVYQAEKSQNQQTGRVMYIVTLDKDHRTIVRQEECEEVTYE